MAGENHAALDLQADQLYTRYVKPLEPLHRGEYVAVSPEGNVLLAKTLPAALAKADRQLGSGTFVFKVGELVAGSLR
jgi:hypothetical protein